MRGVGGDAAHGGKPRSRPSSRAPSPATGAGGAGSDDEGSSQLQLSARSTSGPEGHRCDPALRVALERLDAVRRRRPCVEDFFIPGEEGGEEEATPAAKRAEQPISRVAAEPVQAAPGRGGYGGSPAPFSMDLLMAAISSGPPAGAVLAALSRSTSPGSTHQSSTSGSVGGFSNSSVAATPGGGRGGTTGRLPAAANRMPSLGRQREALPPAREPLPPAGAPPRRPGRQYGLSARSRRMEAAGEAAATDLGMYTAR